MLVYWSSFGSGSMWFRVHWTFYDGVLSIEGGTLQKSIHYLSPAQKNTFITKFTERIWNENILAFLNDFFFKITQTFRDTDNETSRHTNAHVDERTKENVETKLKQKDKRSTSQNVRAVTAVQSLPALLLTNCLQKEENQVKSSKSKRLPTLKWKSDSWNLPKIWTRSVANNYKNLEAVCRVCGAIEHNQLWHSAGHEWIIFTLWSVLELIHPGPIQCQCIGVWPHWCDLCKWRRLTLKLEKFCQKRLPKCFLQDNWRQKSALAKKKHKNAWIFFHRGDSQFLTSVVFTSEQRSFVPALHWCA